MGTIYINEFDKGIVNDPYDTRANSCRYTANFDIITNPHRLTPYRDSESADSSSATSQKRNFAVAYNGTVYALYGLGVISGTNKAEVTYKLISTGASNDFDDATWATTGNYFSGLNITEFSLFCYYKKTGKIYGLANKGSSPKVWAYDPTGAAAFDDAAYNISGALSGGVFTNSTDGIVHSKDDIMYFGVDNYIFANNNGSFSLALTLPTHLYVTSICEKGNHIAIMAAPLNGVGGTRVFLWDRQQTLTVLDDSIDWGEGVGKVIQELDGLLIGISLYGNNSTRFKDRVVFKYWDGYGAKEFAVLEGGTSTQLIGAKQRIDNRLWFMMSITLDGTIRWGTWSIGRRPDNTFSIAHERSPDNDTAFASQVLRGFIKVGDYLFQSYVDASSNMALSKTNDSESYTATSQYQTPINPNMPLSDRPKCKQLISVGALYDALPSGAQVVVKYRVDGTTSWTTIFTETTTGAVRTEPYARIAAGTEFGEFTNIEFLIQSTGGAVVSGLVYRYEIDDSNV